jgi:hypothetical protein
MESIFGGTIEFQTKTQFDTFVDTLDKDMSMKIIELALDYGQKNGLYSFEESHSIYKSLNKLKENADKNQGNHLHNDDSDGDIG